MVITMKQVKAILQFLKTRSVRREVNGVKKRAAKLDEVGGRKEREDQTTSLSWKKMVKFSNC